MTNSPDCRIETVEPLTLAIVSGQSTRATLSTVIRGLFDDLYSRIKATGLAHLGLNVAVYHNVAGQNLLVSADGVPLDIGVRVDAPFDDVGGLRCSATPGGRTATALHVGDYAKLGETYEALHAWMKTHGHRQAGPFWEEYGHWSDDPSQVFTTVRYLLA